MSFVKHPNLTKLTYIQALEITCNKFRDEYNRLVKAHENETEIWAKLDLWQQLMDISSMRLFFDLIYIEVVLDDWS